MVHVLSVLPLPVQRNWHLWSSFHRMKVSWLSNSHVHHKVLNRDRVVKLHFVFLVKQNILTSIQSITRSLCRVKRNTRPTDWWNNIYLKRIYNMLNSRRVSKNVTYNSIMLHVTEWLLSILLPPRGNLLNKSQQIYEKSLHIIDKKQTWTDTS